MTGFEPATPCSRRGSWSPAGAAGRLGITDESLIDGLVMALKDSEPTVVRLSIQALGKVGSKAGIDELITVVNSGPSRLVNEAIEALGLIGDPRGTKPILDALTIDTKETAIQALGKIGDPRAFDPLIETFTAGVNGFVEWYIVAALRDIGARERVYELMASHDNPEVRRMLGRVAETWWPDEAAVGALVTAMSDESAEVRSGAAFKLTDYNLPEALHDTVKSALQKGLDDENEDVRHWCQETLDEWGT